MCADGAVAFSLDLAFQLLDEDLAAAGAQQQQQGSTVWCSSAISTLTVAVTMAFTVGRSMLCGGAPFRCAGTALHTRTPRSVNLSPAPSHYQLFVMCVCPSPPGVRCWFLGERPLLAAIFGFSGSSWRTRFDALPCERLRCAVCVRVARVYDLLAASTADLAGEVHISVRAYGELLAQSECTVPLVGWKGTLA